MSRPSPIYTLRAHPLGVEESSLYPGTMPLKPVRSTLCAFLLPPMRCGPPCLLHAPQVRCASHGRQVPKLRAKPITENTIPNDVGLLDGKCFRHAVYDWPGHGIDGVTDTTRRNLRDAPETFHLLFPGTTY